MTKEQLESYTSMKSEIDDLKSRLATLGENDEFVGHSVINDYRTGYPVPNVITGVDFDRYYSTKDRINKRLEKLIKECDEVEEWVEAIEDSLTRRVFRYYYIDGMSQQMISNTIYYSQGKISTLISNYLNKNTINKNDSYTNN